MEIDYYCFVTDDLINGISEDKRRKNSSIFDNLEFDMGVAKKLSKFAIYDKLSGKFYDAGGKAISLENKTVFPRCIIPDMNLLFDKLEEEKASSIITREDTENVLNWPSFIQPLHRDVYVTTYGDFLKNFGKYKETFKNVFFKTKNKNIHCEILNVLNLNGMSFNSLDTDDDLENNSSKKEETLNEDLYMVMTDKVKGFNDHRFNFLKKDQEVFIQPKLDVVKDSEYPHIPMEYRSFVVDGKFVTSQSWIPERKVPEEVTNLVKLYIDNMPNEMPKTFVLDVLEYEEHGIKKYDICEFNPITCSGYEDGSSIFLLEDNLSEDMFYHLKKDKELGEE